ncbi:ribonuclease H-like domain-containing protein [Tanacetum coccineum]
MTGPSNINTNELLRKLLDRLGLNNTLTNASVSNMGTPIHAYTPTDNIVYHAASLSVSSHLNNSVTSLSENFNMCMYPSISVSDGHSIPVTNTGHSILPTPLKSLHLNNVLITPRIVKNLIYVHQFVRDNNCTIEFDAFGFFVKDFITRRVLLRCDSTGDLYPVMDPSSIPHVFLVSQHTWHQRLGHPGRKVLRHLVSNNFISCNKEKPPMLCHSCQLGKHVRLPFVSSNTVVTSCFDIIHSDVLTSPISSLSGFKYYIIISHHVTFDKTVFRYGSTQPTLPPTYTFLDDIPDIIPPAIPTNPAVQLPPEPITPIHNTPIQHHPDAAQLPTYTSPQQLSPAQVPTTDNQAHSPPPSTSTVQQQTLTLTQSAATQNELVAQSPIIIPDPPKNLNPVSVHPMVTRFCVGTNRPTEFLNLHVSSVSPLPKSYHDAFSDPNWQNTMHDEYHALIKKTWTLVPTPPDTNIVRCMWLFHHKYLADGTLSRYKARLVENGSTQLEGVDVDETFSSVVKLGTIRTVLSLAASRHWPIHQLDVKNAFLHGDLSETVYMHQPPGFRDSAHPDYIIRSLHREFSMRDMASLNYFLGISVTRDSSGMFLFQKKYAVEILEWVGMVNCNPSQTPIDTESKLGDTGDVPASQSQNKRRKPISHKTSEERNRHIFVYREILPWVEDVKDYQSISLSDSDEPSSSSSDSDQPSSSSSDSDE